MASTACIIYWYGEDDLPHDGGGIRVRAWKNALVGLGYDVFIQGMVEATPRTSRTLLSDLKKRLVPMPFSTSMREYQSADLTVATVPAAFKSVASFVPPEKLLFDWMDLWSVNSMTMGSSSAASLPGGFLQSLLWKRRERLFPHMAKYNAFAGYGDFQKLNAGLTGGNSNWLPTPVELPYAASIGSRRTARKIRRLGFIGNFRYPPNVMSLRWFVEKYAAELEASQIELLVAGYGSEIVSDWGVRSVEVLGRVASLSDFYNNIDAAVVPIQHGGGVKVKAIEAWAHGVPTVGTLHVQAGFSPEFHKYVQPLDTIFHGSMADHFPSKEEFDSAFSQEAFSSKVADLLNA